MKKSAISLLIPVLMFCLDCKKTGKNTVLGADTDVHGMYKNGSYEGTTPKDGEGYNALATIVVWKNLISTVDWGIYDNRLERYFDATYEEVYADYPPYIQQCRDNMKGMVAYGPSLIETQNIDSVECITGATWCFNKFRQVVRIALKDAALDTAASSP